MTSISANDWSPADNPYAIAVSQSQLWRDIVLLTIRRMRDENDRGLGWSSSVQLDAHVLVMTLRQLLTAEQLEQVALRELGMESAGPDALTQARRKFEEALPGIKHMRDALTHFDEWLRGTGRGPQLKRIRAGEAVRDVARDYAGFGYDRTEGTVSFGPYTIHIDIADKAAVELCQAIYTAAHEVDKKKTAERRSRAIEALERSGVRCDAPDAQVTVSPGTDLQIWLSLNPGADSDEEERRELAEQIVVALKNGGFQLKSNDLAESVEPAQRLLRGDVLPLEPNA